MPVGQCLRFVDRFDIEDAPGDSENHGMGFMPEFGPPKGFPDLSKLTGGEFSKMGAPSNGGGIESYGQGGGKHRPFHQFSPQGKSLAAFEAMKASMKTKEQSQ